MNRYKCRECGYIHIGDEPPAVCPVCGYDSEVFYKMEDSTSSDENIFYDTIDSFEESILKSLRQRVASYSELSAIANAMSIQAVKENRKEDAELFKACSDMFLNHASVSTMLLGEFLEFNTDSNKNELAKKIIKEEAKIDKLLEDLSSEGLDDSVELIEKERKELKEKIRSLEN